MLGQLLVVLQDVVKYQFYRGSAAISSLQPKRSHVILMTDKL